MPKISSLQEEFSPNPRSVVLIAPPAAIDYKSYLAALANTVGPGKIPAQASDLFSASLITPFSTTAIGAGTCVPVTNEANHPGIVRISSGAAANTGHVISLGNLSAVLIGGSEVAEFVMKLKLVANHVARFGFFDVVNTATPTDAVHFVHTGTVIEGRAYNNGVLTSTATSYTPVADTWYRLKLEINSTANLATFSLYDCATGTLLWSDTISSNIPTATGRETGFGVLSYKSSLNSAALLDVDYMAYYINKALTR